MECIKLLKECLSGTKDLVRVGRKMMNIQVIFQLLSVVYFQITHCLGRPHYMWDEYLYSVL